MLANVCTSYTLPFFIAHFNWIGSCETELQFCNIHAMSEWIEYKINSQILLLYYVGILIVKRNFNRSALFLLNDQKDEPKLEPAIVPETLLSDLCFGSDLFFFTFTRAHTHTYAHFPNVALSSFFNLIRLSTLAYLRCFCCYSISTHVLAFLFCASCLLVCVCGNCRYILMRV